MTDKKNEDLMTIVSEKDIVAVGVRYEDIDEQIRSITKFLNSQLPSTEEANASLETKAKAAAKKATQQIALGLLFFTALDALPPRARQTMMEAIEKFSGTEDDVPTPTGPKN